MAPSDDARDLTAGQSVVLALINDYRSHQEALCAQALSLARMREEVLNAANREAGGIVAAARAEVQQAIVKARRDLLALAAQVQAAIETPQETGHAPNLGDVEQAVRGQTDGLRVAHDVFASARRDVRRVLDDVGPDLEALDEKLAAIRFDPMKHQTPALARASRPPAEAVSTTAVDDDGRTVVTTAPAVDPVSPVEDPVLAAEPPALSFQHPIAVHRSVKAFVFAFVAMGISLLMATVWWLQGSSGNNDASPQLTVEPVVTESGASQPAVAAIDAASRDASAEPPHSLVVNIETRRPAWMRVVVDGRVTSARLFEAGETQQVTGSREVSIRAGDAGAVLVSVNGGDATAIGPDGQAVTRRFALPGAAEPEGASPSSPAANTSSVSPREGSVEEGPPPPPVAQGQAPEARPQASPFSLDAPPATLTAGAAPPASTLATAPQSPPPAAASLVGAPLPQRDIVRDAERWLDAYSRQDRGAMAAFSDDSVSVSDERTQSERLMGTVGVRRELEDVRIQFFGESAIFSARMTERRENTGAARPPAADAFVSQIWTRRAGGWRLSDVRIVSRATLERAFR